MKVMIVVTHLLGTGHLTRALTLGQAFHAAGHEVHLVSGGMWPAHIHHPEFSVVQLSPIASDGVDFTRLLTSDGTPADADFMAARHHDLVATLNAVGPDALITELFPFGRRNLKSEFIALLQATKKMQNSPVVFGSVRDILAPPSKPAKVDFARDTLAQFYDAVLVHSAKEIMPLTLSWPISQEISAQLRYTGFVAPPLARRHPDRDGAGEVLVTAGGGDVGAALFATAKEAAKIDTARVWRCLVGGTNADETSARMQADASSNFIAEPARPDFRQMLHHAAASVSMCGYNTALDLLQTNCPAVFIPFDDGDEVEQTIRAGALSQSAGIERVLAADLTASSLLHALQEAARVPRSAIDPTHTNGAHHTVEIVTEIWSARHVG